MAPETPDKWDGDGRRTPVGWRPVAVQEPHAPPRPGTSSVRRDDGGLLQGQHPGDRYVRISRQRTAPRAREDYHVIPGEGPVEAKGPVGRARAALRPPPAG